MGSQKFKPHIKLGWMYFSRLGSERVKPEAIYSSAYIRHPMVAIQGKTITKIWQIENQMLKV